jgi:hypothetical protein
MDAVGMCSLRPPAAFVYPCQVQLQNFPALIAEKVPHRLAIETSRAAAFNSLALILVSLMTELILKKIGKQFGEPFLESETITLWRISKSSGR